VGLYSHMYGVAISCNATGEHTGTCTGTEYKQWQKQQKQQRHAALELTGQTSNLWAASPFRMERSGLGHFNESEYRPTGPWTATPACW